MSDKSFDQMELDQFYTLVDDVLDGLESGKIEPKEVAPKHRVKSMEDIVVKGDSTESGELDTVEVIGKVGKRMVVVTPEDGSEPTVYGSPSEAARRVNLTPTTIKGRCDANKVDAKGNTWSYKDVE